LKISLKVDGVYGKASLGAVKSFQSANFLKPDGIIGPLTRAKLNGVK
ncbi:peptidoglycan-binding protein, partial [Candidatus Nomurabacteria bacterium]|nr:peptidoglycan-binding protein [Candidatus Nomurabacteria bacterium]